MIAVLLEPRFVLAGDGPLRATLEEMAKEHKVEDLTVESWEFVSSHAIEAEYVESIASSVSLL